MSCPAVQYDKDTSEECWEAVRQANTGARDLGRVYHMLMFMHAIVNMYFSRHHLIFFVIVSYFFLLN